ncbi:NAD(P)/FAD-dependent oxidoreductase [Streptomyces sp. NPDC003077]|uniref:FAD-dependent oxidoreductase n=1 Tax=Streptomyces sp. NPDC003077 TaxID=3154443 RepID=UPI0033AE88A2
MKALIIGGGIAGPAAAMALRRAGIDATVYEARPSGAEGAGVFLTLGSNGIDALRAIGADTEVVSAGFPTPEIVVYSGTGKRLGVTRVSGTAGSGPVSHTLQRAGLYGALRDEARRRGVPFVHGKRLTAAEETPDEVRALFADGSEATGDLLIGCDGIHSAVRRLIDPTAPAPAYAGLLGLGGYTRGVPVDVEPGSYHMIFGKRGFFGYALAPGGDVWWFANVPRPDEPARHETEAIGAEEWRARLVRMFADDAGPAARLVRASQEILPAGPLHTVPRLPLWHRHRMIVIGDAAHAPSPSSGQGASLSLEDAVELAKCLRDRPGIEEAFSAYEALRRPRVERIVRQAARINNSKAAGPVGRVVRDALMPLVLKLTADGKQLRRTYDHRTDWDAPAPAATPAR